MAEARGSWRKRIPPLGAEPLGRVGRRGVLLGILMSAVLAAGGIYLYPGSTRIVLAASVGLAIAVVLLRLPMDVLMPLFLFSICFTAWIPVSIQVANLNIRASQLLLPVVYYRWLTSRASLGVSRELMLVLLSGGIMWGALLFWTVVHWGASLEAIGPLGRVVLLALNLLHVPPIAFYAVRPERWGRAVLALLVSITILNGVLLVAAIGMQLGFHVAEGWILMQQAPVVLGRQVSAGLVPRFTVGVTSGVMSAVAVIIGTMYLLFPPRALRNPWLWIIALVGSIGMVVGFSRQAVISLAGGAGASVLALLRHGQLKLALRAAVLTLVVTAAGVGIMSVFPGGRPFQDAFIGRSVQIVQPQEYRVGTVEARIVLWRGMLRDVARNPLIGAGQDVYVKYMMNPEERGAHNFAIEILHAAGLVGFLAYIVLHATLFAIAWRLWNSSLRKDGQRWIRLGVAGGYLAVWLSSLTNLIYTNPVYWAVIGLLVAAGQMDDGTFKSTRGGVERESPGPMRSESAWRERIRRSCVACGRVRNVFRRRMAECVFESESESTLSP